MRRNPKGVHFERWRHDADCGRWFDAARDTVPGRFLAVYKMDGACPHQPGEGEL